MATLLNSRDETAKCANAAAPTSINMQASTSGVSQPPKEGRVPASRKNLCFQRRGKGKSPAIPYESLRFEFTPRFCPADIYLPFKEVLTDKGICVCSYCGVDIPHHSAPPMRYKEFETQGVSHADLVAARDAVKMGMKPCDLKLAGLAGMVPTPSPAQGPVSTTVPVEPGGTTQSRYEALGNLLAKEKPVSPPVATSAGANPASPVAEAEKKIDLLDGYVLSREEHRDMFKDQGYHLKEADVVAVQDRMYVPSRDERLVADRNVKLVQTPIRIISVSANVPDRLKFWPVTLVSVAIALSFMIPLIMIQALHMREQGCFIHGYRVMGPPICHESYRPALTYFISSAWRICCISVLMDIILSFAVLLAVLYDEMPLCIRKWYPKKFVRFFWVLAHQVHYHYAPHIISSLHKESCIHSSYEAEAPNLMMKIRRLSALPISDVMSLPIIEGSLLAYKVFMDSRNFIRLTLDALLLNTPAGRCSL